MVKERTADASLYTKYMRESVNSKLTLRDKDIRVPPASRVSIVSQSPYGVNMPVSFHFRFGGQSADRYVTLSDVLLSIVSGTTRNLILNFNLSRPGQLPVGVELYRNTSASTTGGTLISSSTVPPTFTASNVYPYYHYYAKATLNSEYTSNIVNTLNPLGQRFAGNYADGFSGDGGPANQAQILNPSAVVFNDSNTMLYIGDGNRRVRQVNMATNVITTIIGNGSADSTATIAGGAAGTSVGIAIPARFAYFEPLLFIVDSSTRIRAYNTSGATATFGGVSVSAGHIRTVATVSSGGLYGIAADSNGNIFVANADGRIHRILKNTGTISIVAGNGTNGYSGDGGLASSAVTRVPTGCDIDKTRNVLYISDRDNLIIRAVNLNASGSVTVAGVTIAAGNIDRVAGIQGQNQIGYPEGDGGQARSSKFQGDSGFVGSIWTISIDPLGNIYIGDGNFLRRVSVDTGIITGVTGYGGVSIDNVSAYSRISSNTMQCAFGPDNSIYVTTFGNNAVQRIY